MHPLFLQTAEAMETVSDSAANVTQKATETVTDIVEQVQTGNVDALMSDLLDWGIDIGKSIILAAVLYMVGHILIKLINKLFAKVIDRRSLDQGVKTFLKSFVNILLTILLIVAVVSALGVDTTSFAALLASAGIAIGMALSGNLQNFAGGILILLLKPFKVGDYIEAQDSAGTVKEIQIFHTIITTPDNKEIYIPNGSLSSGSVVNFSHNGTRRIDFVVGIDYGEDTDRVRPVLRKLADEEPLIEQNPEPQVLVNALSSSSVDILLRVWVKNENYWDVYYGINEKIYKSFNEEGINFPYPQLTVHTEKV